MTDSDEGETDEGELPIPGRYEEKVLAEGIGSTISEDYLESKKGSYDGTHCTGCGLRLSRHALDHIGAACPTERLNQLEKRVAELERRLKVVGL